MLENIDEFIADNFSFLFRIGNAAELRQESLAGVDILKPDVKILGKHALDDFLFPSAQQSVVNENAGELISDRFVQKRGRD